MKQLLKKINPPPKVLRELAITLPSILLVMLWVSARLGDNWYWLMGYIVLDNIANRLWLRLTEKR